MLRIAVCVVLCVGAGATLAAFALDFAAAPQAAADRSVGKSSLASPRRQGTPEEQLAAKYAPILYIKRQSSECDSDGDPYDPEGVEIVLGQPGVVVKRNEPGRPIVAERPTAADVFGLGREYYIDWPGNPRSPGCDYERDYRALAEDTSPLIYAHVATETGVEGLAVQYFFFYYFNDFLNLHEGDWETIQVSFDVDSAAEALEREPVELAYSSHAGGEKAAWGDSKVEKEQERPVVYVARGSHASYFRRGVYLGVAREGAVFGCDRAQPEFRRVDARVQLLPHEVIGATSPFAWIEFEGGWGEEAGSLFSGPTGPKQKVQWESPFTWQQGLRNYSEKLPEGEVLGVDPLQPICAVIRTGSVVLNAFAQNPAVVGAGIGFAFMAAVGLVMGVPSRLRGVRPTRSDVERPDVSAGVGSLGRQAANLYVANWGLFSLIGAAFLPLGILATAFQERLGLDRLEDLVSNRAAGPLFVLALGSLQAFVAIVVVGGAAIAAAGNLNAGQSASFGTCYRAVLGRFWTLLAVHLQSAILLVLLAVSVVGLPWAIHRTIAWAFVGQAVILDDASARGALKASSDAVRGNWWRTAAALLGVVIVVILPGPIIGLAFLLFASPPVSDTVYVINAALYALLLLPFALTATTLLYTSLKTRKNPDLA